MRIQSKAFSNGIHCYCCCNCYACWLGMPFGQSAFFAVKFYMKQKKHSFLCEWFKRFPKMVKTVNVLWRKDWNDGQWTYHKQSSISRAHIHLLRVENVHAFFCLYDVSPLLFVLYTHTQYWILIFLMTNINQMSVCACVYASAGWRLNAFIKTQHFANWNIQQQQQQHINNHQWFELFCIYFVSSITQQVSTRALLLLLFVQKYAMIFFLAKFIHI